VEKMRHVENYSRNGERIKEKDGRGEFNNDIL
jgi:hypothetical protein